jgi:hypothetical protein
MGHGYIIGCNKCFSSDNIPHDWHDNENIKGTFFDIAIGSGMLCFCKEQLERYYGIFRDYNRDCRLLAAGDPPDEVYKNIPSPVEDKEINTKIFEKLHDNYEFTEKMGYEPYYCDKCKTLSSEFYFQMKKDKIMFTPEYKCKECNSLLEKVSLMWENEKIAKIEGVGKKLLCKNCNNDVFIILDEYLWD